jgi:hypothetical protein
LSIPQSTKYHLFTFFSLNPRERLRSALKLPAELATGYSSVQGIEFGISPRSISAESARYKGSPDIALGKIAEHLGFLPQQIQSRYRSRAFSNARAVLVHPWAAVGRPITEIASLIGISSQAAYYLARTPVDRHLIQYLVSILLQ